MKEKKLLIVERSNALNYHVEDVLNENNEKVSESIVLTGLFTSFNVKNRNGRIYESADFLPHVEALRETIEQGRLLGELDHPHGFEVSLKNVSHVVESLEFDPQQNAIVGKIRLLNTSAGREAKGLIEGGVPLSISSRAAGSVDNNGRVKLQQLFTYDLVADPGFANAQLKRVNESYGFGDCSNIDIFEISEDAYTELDPKVVKTADYAEPQAAKNADTLNHTDITNTTTNNTNNMDQNQNNYISYSDFQKYSEHLAEIITDLQSAFDNCRTELAGYKGASQAQAVDGSKVDNSMIADMVAKEVAAQKGEGAPVVGAPEDKATELEAKAAEQETKIAEMEEKYNNVVAYAKYLAETIDKTITHNDHIVEETNKIIEHNNYLAENMNKMIAHQDYLAENINNTIAYQNYVAEMVDKHIDYTNMLAEEQNKTIAHNDYLVEKMNQMIDHQDYLAENMNNMISHQDYIVEEVNNMSENLIVEDRNKKTNTIENNPVVESVNTKPAFDSKAYQTEITDKITSLITTVKEQYAEAKRKEAEAIEESRRNSSNAANFNLINYMPARLHERWSKLSDDRKKEILAESKMLIINNSFDAEYFWNTRDMREKQITMQKVEENVTAKPANPVNESNVSNERLEAYKAMIQRNMRRY